MEKRNRNDEKKSFMWVEMALWGDLTVKYIHPFCYSRDLLLLFWKSELKTGEISVIFRYFCIEAKYDIHTFEDVIFRNVTKTFTSLKNFNII